MIKNVYVCKFARALVSYVEAARVNKHPKAVVARGDKVRKTLRALGAFLHRHNGWSNLARNVKGLDDPFWLKSAPHDSLDVESSPSGCVDLDVTVTYSITMRDMGEVFEDVQSRFGLVDLVSLDEAPRLWVISDGWSRAATLM